LLVMVVPSPLYDWLCFKALRTLPNK
jgi:hypothetical protein